MDSCEVERMGKTLWFILGAVGILAAFLAFGPFFKNGASPKAGAAGPGSLVGADASGPRFYIQTKDGKAKAAVVFSGGTPAGFKDGMQVVVNGVVDASGTLTATSVALSK